MCVRACVRACARACVCVRERVHVRVCVRVCVRAGLWARAGACVREIIMRSVDNTLLTHNY